MSDRGGVYHTFAQDPLSLCNIAMSTKRAGHNERPGSIEVLIGTVSPLVSADRFGSIRAP